MLWKLNHSREIKEAWKKKKGLQQHSNPWPPQDQCHVLPIVLLHNDVIYPKGSMGVEVTLKSKMAASGASTGGNSKSTGSLTYLKPQTNHPRRVIWQHDCHLNFSLGGNTTPYCIRSWLKLPWCTFEPRKHYLTSLCIRSSELWSHTLGTSSTVSTHLLSSQ